MNIRIVVAGVVLLGVGALGAWDVVSKSNWVPATATVLAVKTSCDMKATERGLLTKTTSTATIDCELADAFVAFHADKSWTKIERFDGTLSVVHDGQAPVVALMSLHRIDGRPPKMGDVMAVSQNPAAPTKIRPADQAASFSMLSVASGVIGLLLLLLGLRKRRAPRLTPEQVRLLAAMQAAGINPAAMPAQATAAAAAAPMNSPQQRTVYVPPAQQSPVVSGRRAFGRRA